MSKPIGIALAGPGAFGQKHLDALKNIPGVSIVSIIGRNMEQAKEVAAKYGAAHVTSDLAESLARSDVDAVILCTPTQIHAEQTIQCLRAGKHVQVEIPLADSWADAQEVVRVQKERAWWPWWAIPDALIRATSGSIRKLLVANTTFSRWMCRPIFSGAPI